MVIDSLRWKNVVVREVADDSKAEADASRESQTGAADARSALGKPMAFDKELLVNPGCEEPLRADGQIVGWTMRSGTWHRGKPDVSPAAGTGYFSASNLRRGPGPDLAELFQDVDLTGLREAIDGGKVKVSLCAKVQSFDQRPGDATRILVTFFDAAGQQLGIGHDSGEVVSHVWKALTANARVPSKTRTIRVTLQSVRHQKRGQTSNDGHFDEVSLRLTR